MKKTIWTMSLVVMALLSSCNKEEAAPTPTLYDRLGGVNAISAVVDQFIANVAANPKMVRTFKPLLDDVGKGNTARVTALRNNLIDQIGEAAGGPQKYKGKDMVTAHKGMNITEDEFNSLVNDLVLALDKFKVPATEKGELLGVLGGLKGMIVGK
ncbi:MAG: group 1 truncated hemoglobin [Spirosomaceae bacterium]|jgi:hemoglobin|nr:group 1 truncated hemoglobin [Spirosomataceae bacterium]